MKPYMDSVKLKVDKEDIVVDFFHYYKSPKFNEVVPIKVQMREEPAIDTWGGCSTSSIYGCFSRDC